MNCEKCSKYLIDYVEGNLSHSEETVINDHLNTCKACTAQLEKIKGTLLIMKMDSLPHLTKVKKQALFPLIMERAEERTISARRKRRWTYSLSSGFALILIVIISVIGIRNQQKPDYYAVFFSPDRLIYEEDTVVNSYLVQSLTEKDTIITDIKEAADEAWIMNTELAALVDVLTDEELNHLVEKLETIEFNGG